MSAPVIPADTLGALDSAVIEGARLVASGWAASHDAGPVVGFRAIYGGHVLADCRAQCGLPSPDVQAAHPQLDHAGMARFQLSASLKPGVPIPPPASAIILTPLLDAGREGQPLVSLWNADLPLPPVEYQARVGHGDFNLVSQQLLGQLIGYGGLQPGEDVLDVNCGVGRVARALAYYLARTARYEGFDSARDLVEWCQQSVTVHFPNFRFQHVDIRDPMRNARGTVTPLEFVFPYPPASFDFVFLTSVFTHTRAAEARHYLDEIYRVLRPGGRCLFTCFLMNDVAARLIGAGRSSLQMVHPVPDGGYTSNPDMPEAAIGFEEHEIMDWCVTRGFELQKIHYGTWPGRKHADHYQDLIAMIQRTS